MDHHDSREETRKTLALSQSALTTEERTAGNQLTMTKPVMVRFVGTVMLGQIGYALESAGLEAYSDCTGAICVRTIEEGDRHRYQVQVERQRRRDEMARHLERCQPYRPFICENNHPQCSEKVFGRCSQEVAR